MSGGDHHHHLSGGSLHSHEGGPPPPRQSLHSHSLRLPFPNASATAPVRDPFSLAHEMLMHSGRHRADNPSSSATSSIILGSQATDEGGTMLFHGARPRVQSPDIEEETNSSRSWSEADDGGPFYTSPDPPLVYQEPHLPSSSVDIPTALSSLMSLSTSDYFPGQYPPLPGGGLSGSSSDISSKSSRMTHPHHHLQRTPTLMTDLPESLISPMRLSKPKRSTSKATNETSTSSNSKSSSSASASGSSSNYSTSTSYSRDSYSPTREEMEREIEMKKKKCEVCGDVARSLHFGGLACDSCKAFFRRGVISGGYKDFVCGNNDTCTITVANRRSCQACRFAGCLKAGMSMALVQHDPKNAGGRQYSKVSDHPVFQQDPTSEYREGQTGTLASNSSTSCSRLSRTLSRRESSSSSSSQLYDSGDAYGGTYGGGYGYQPYTSDGDIDRGTLSYDSSIGISEPEYSRRYSTEGWDSGVHKGNYGTLKVKKGHSRQGGEVSEKIHPKSNCGASDSSVKSLRSLKEVKSYLGSQDYSEIKKLHSIYLQSFNMSVMTLEDKVINESNLGVYYSYFVQSRAKFLIGIPLYKTLAAKDKKKILQIAVSMSTYIVGAQYVDLDTHVLENKDEVDGPVMPINTMRQFLTNDQFVEVMMFFSNHSHLYSDLTVSILMQIMGLTYPEPGLSDSVVVEAGRCQYGGLLSRYLMAVHGSEVGQQYFQTLLESQHEARKLAGMLQHLELVHQAPQRDNSSIKKILGDGIRLVCDEAREGLSKSIYEQRYQDEYRDYYAGQSSTDAIGASASDMNRFHIIENTLKQLARCDDPTILAEARRILPVDLLKRFSEQLQDPSD